MGNLQEWTRDRSNSFLEIAKEYCESRTQFRKQDFYDVLLHTFLGGINTVAFDWNFTDLGLVYQSKVVGQIGTQRHILCHPTQRALELFKVLPLPEITKRRLCDGSLTGEQFETALCHQLICATTPVLLNATDLNGGNATIISLDFSHCETLRAGMNSLGLGHEKVLTLSYKGYPRFDFMLGPMFIQASVSDFGNHNTGSADLNKAFDNRDGEGMNQIERYLNDMFGPSRSAMINDNKFVVTRNDVPVPGFRIVYMRDSPGRTTRRDWVRRLPDVRHASFEEHKGNLFKNIVQVRSLGNSSTSVPLKPL